MNLYGGALGRCTRCNSAHAVNYFHTSWILSAKQKSPPPCSMDNIKMDMNTDQNFLQCVSSCEGTSYKSLLDTVTRSFISC